ncbi:hypothetical protein [Snodgrassella alvi]|nr:hypothetical protein [Snodgrassella alvi]
MQESKQLSSTDVSVQGGGCQADNSPQPKRTLSVAPMLDWIY